MINTHQSYNLGIIKKTIKKLENIRDNPKITTNKQVKAQMYIESLDNPNPGNYNKQTIIQQNGISSLIHQARNEVINYNGYKINPQTLLSNAKAKASLTQYTPIKSSIYIPSIKKHLETPSIKVKF